MLIKLGKTGAGPSNSSPSARSEGSATSCTPAPGSPTLGTGTPLAANSPRSGLGSTRTLTEAITGIEPSERSLRGDLLGATVVSIVEITNNVAVAFVLAGNWPKDYIFYLFLHTTLGNIFAQATTTCTSDFPGALSVAGFETLGLLQVLRGDVSELMPDASSEAQLVTFLVISSLVNVVSSAMVGLMSHPVLTNALNYLPDHLRSGVFAGIGLQLLFLGFDTYGMTWTDSSTWSTSDAWMKWFPAYILGMLFFALDERFSYTWLMVGFIAVVTVGCHSIFAILGLSLSDAVEQGHLLGDVEAKWCWEFYVFVFQRLGKVNLGVVWKSASSILMAAFVGPTLNVAINTMVLKFMFENKGSYSHEFRSQAFGLFISGPLLGYNSYFSISDTNIMRNAGGSTSRAAMLHVIQLIAVCIAKPVAPAIILLCPNVLVAAIFVYIGIGILKGCLVDEVANLLPQERYSVYLIVIACFAFGILQGLVMGFLLCMFVANYQDLRACCLRSASDLSSAESGSCRSYSLVQEQTLRKNGGRVLKAVIQSSQVLMMRGAGDAWAVLGEVLQQRKALVLVLECRCVHTFGSGAMRMLAKTLGECSGCIIALVNLDLSFHDIAKVHFQKHGVEVAFFNEKMDRSVQPSPSPEATSSQHWSDDEILSSTSSNSILLSWNLSNSGMSQRMTRKGGLTAAAHNALVFAEQQLLRCFLVAERSDMPLLGYVNQPIDKWPVKTRISALVKCLSAALRLYFSTDRAMGRNLFSFALHGRCSLRRLAEQENLTDRDSSLGDAVVLLCAGIVRLTDRRSLLLREFAVPGEVVVTTMRHIRFDNTICALDRPAIVLIINIGYLAEDTAKDPLATVALLRMLQTAQVAQRMGFIGFAPCANILSHLEIPKPEPSGCCGRQPRSATTEIQL